MEEQVNVVPLSAILWVVSCIGVPLIGWGVKITWDLLRTREDIKVVVRILRNPDQSGFGSRQTNETLATSHRQLTACIEANTKVVQELIHYIKWSFKERTGKELPPAIGED